MWHQSEPTSESEIAISTFGKDHAHARSQRGCEAENDGSYGRAGDDVELPTELSSDLLPQALRDLRVFEHAELLNEVVRVATGGKPEVTFQNGAVALENLQYLVLIQAETSARKARIAIWGSGAAVTGRPTTSTSAPRTKA